MLRGTIQTKIDAEGNGRPGWILGTTIEASLQQGQYVKGSRGFSPCDLIAATSVLSRSLLLGEVGKFDVAHLVSWLGLQLLKNCQGIGLGSDVGHHSGEK